MTFRSTASFALVFAVLAAGCAADPQSSSAANAPKAEREYRTGSNIPVREPRKSADEERARAAADAEAQQRSGTIAKPN
jgi:hypothetical protein